MVTATTAVHIPWGKLDGAGESEYTCPASGHHHPFANLREKGDGSLAQNKIMARVGYKMTNNTHVIGSTDYFA